ncbi:hypothetical protein KSX_86830 [Ktedonospora formicarum]|uniref:Transposase n=1 Tax=Ktedonospora formicarum TaxID=2778364 RepID=A0A8J3IC22_9CHLR|nr:hypothetical protein KSX_86830 [Ktedonospora formicarum]
MSRQHSFKWRHFQPDTILLCVRWYLRYVLSYRDLEEIMLEWGLRIDHTTIYRWVQRYAPELEKRCQPYLKACNDSWRADETNLKIKKSLGLSLPSRRFRREHTGVSLEPDARCRGSETFLPENTCFDCSFRTSGMSGC